MNWLSLFRKLLDSELLVPVRFMMRKFNSDIYDLAKVPNHCESIRTSGKVLLPQAENYINIECDQC